MWGKIWYFFKGYKMFSYNTILSIVAFLEMSETAQIASFFFGDYAYQVLTLLATIGNAILRFMTDTGIFKKK